ncbi:ABC-type antimicrobial peptide transport system permease subunit [Fontibacillus solani]|uniref:ABC-type antimicrobial peptide transport system permease subunit n=1 Tax=Fontibacillus solani TaxID=1572857 RepID=A0A7W3SY50_9BACL|nr:FtsX-like permease family protein [Fontibacillus solani]MBA9088391.1 ABC-type antimicrobial peptide transport system permease subunit [Fontibacillus solani]
MLIGVMLGTVLLTSVVLLGQMLHASIKKQQFDQFGYTDIMVGYRTAEQGLTPEQMDQITSSTMVQGFAQILAAPKIPGLSPDFYVVGVDNSEIAKSTYKFTQALQPFEIVLTERLAERWGVELHGKTSIPSLPSSQPWVVKEIIPDRYGPDGPLPDYAIFHLQSLQENVGSDVKVNLLLIDLVKDHDKQKFLRFVKDNLDPIPDVDIVGNPEEGDKLNSFLVIGYALGIMVVFASGFMILSSFYITVQQRKKELALLRMIGGSPGQLKLMVCIEALTIAIIGSFLGSLMGVLLTKITINWMARYLAIPLFSVSISYEYVAVTAISIALFIFLTSLIPAHKASKVLPMEFLNETLDENLRPRNTQKWLAIGLLIISLLCAGIGRWGDQESSLHVLFYVVGGLMISSSLYILTPFWISPVLRILSPLLERIAGIESKIAVQNLIFQRAQSTLAVIIIGLSMTLTIPIVTIYTWIGDNMLQQIESNYISDILVSSNKSMRSTVPLEIQEDLQQIPGVKTAIAVSVNRTLILDNYDFSKSNQRWLNLKSSLSPLFKDEHNKPVLKREVANYKLVHIHSLVKELNLQLPQEIESKNAVMITAHYAEMLGVRKGDTLEFFIVPLAYKEPYRQVKVTIAAVLDQLYANEDSLLLDWNNSALTGLDQPNVHSVMLYVDPTQKTLVDQHIKMLQMNKYGEINWSDRSTQLQELSKQMSQRILILGATFMLLLMMGLSGMANHLSAILLTKRREMSILRMISATHGQIRKIVIVQCGLFGMIGIVIGVITGWLITLYFSQIDNGHIYNAIREQLYIVICVVVFTFILSLLLGSKEARMVSESKKSNIQMD